MSAGSPARKWHRLLAESAGAKAIYASEKERKLIGNERYSSLQTASCQYRISIPSHFTMFRPSTSYLSIDFYVKLNSHYETV